MILIQKKDVQNQGKFEKIKKIQTLKIGESVKFQAKTLEILKC
jgi:hypothetical protein